VALTLAVAVAAHGAAAQLRPDGATASFRGSLPPPAVAPLSAAQEAGIERRLTALDADLAAVAAHPRSADVAVLLKAVRLALDFDEWYDADVATSLGKVDVVLDEAARRIAALRAGRTPWLEGPGPRLVGFTSTIDDSPQPYGVEVPEGIAVGPGHDPVPMWIWLHGRGDTATDLHFIHARLTARRPGPFAPAGAIVVHPFGRFCNGWKSAGETDVLECRDDALARFNVDPDRVVLAGFSMGGAGAWHLGAHHADQWACVHAGAGFVDVKRYQKLTPDRYPPWYEQALWGLYDVPDAARNLFNVPLVVYSGADDPQRDAAEYMLEVLAREGLRPPHLIGPATGHRYHPETAREVRALVEQAVARGRDRFPDEVHVQARTPFHGRMKWIDLHGMETSWREARLDARVVDAATLDVTTTNVSRVVLYPPPQARGGGGRLRVRIDGQSLDLAVGPERPGFETFLRPGPPVAGSFCRLARQDGRWHDAGNERPFAETGTEGGKCRAHPGPMDAAFTKRFLVVMPDGSSSAPQVDAWVEAESRRFVARWRSLMRGTPRVTSAAEVPDPQTAGRTQSLILWGTPESNSCIRALLPELPLEWDAARVGLRGREPFDAMTHVPALTYPCPGSAGFEVVINSGLTFREAHDRTNSLQNPKLPDWVVFDVSAGPPDAESAGKVVAADFFDDRWQVR
jgi:predicted esterase